MLKHVQTINSSQFSSRPGARPGATLAHWSSKLKHGYIRTLAANRRWVWTIPIHCVVPYQDSWAWSFPNFTGANKPIMFCCTKHAVELMAREANKNLVNWHCGKEQWQKEGEQTSQELFSHMVQLVIDEIANTYLNWFIPGRHWVTMKLSHNDKSIKLAMVQTSIQPRHRILD